MRKNVVLGGVAVLVLVLAALALSDPQPIEGSKYARTWLHVFVKRSCKFNPLMGSACLDPGGLGRGFRWQQVPEASARSFTVIGGYGVDRNHVFVGSEVLTLADPGTFVAGDGFVRDAHHVWAGGFRLVEGTRDLDGSSYQPLGCGVVKDAQGVYARALDEDEVRSAPIDAIQRYERLPLDPGSTRMDGQCHLVDASGGWKVTTALRDNFRVTVVVRD